MNILKKYLYINYMSINKWGPAVWLLFHTIVEKIKEPDNTRICRELFYQIQNICKFLPCPDCASHATSNLATGVIPTPTRPYTPSINKFGFVPLEKNLI